MAQDPEVVLIPEAELRAFVSQVLTAAGVPAEDAALMASGLVEADLRGNHSHGVLHLANYLHRIRLGLTNPNASPVTLVDELAVAVIDAQHGLGHVIGCRAMDLAVEKARDFGLGCVAVRNSTHFGMGALYSERAVAAGMAGVALSNSTPLLAAPGGAQRVLGTNPIAIAFPGPPGEPPISFDLGLGAITLGEVRDRYQRGELLPPDVAVDAEGRPTRDPQAVLNGGVLLPFAGHRGFGLALVVELLAGVITGAGIADEVGALFEDYDRKQRTGHLFLAIDLRRFLPPDEYARRVRQLTGWLKGSRRAAGEPPLRLPGERSSREAAERRRTGIPLPGRTYASVQQVAREWGVPAPVGRPVFSA